jgi:hypothetical protein
LATNRSPGARVTGYVAAWAAAVYFVYRLLALQETTGFSWSPFGSIEDDRVGPGMWLLVLATVALAGYYTRQERATRRALGVRLSSQGADRLNQRATLLAAAGIFVLTVLGLAMPLRERSSSSVKTYDYLSGDFSAGVAYQVLRAALLISLLILIATCLLARIKPRALRIVGYVLAAVPVVSWSYHVLRIHDADLYNNSYSVHLGFGAWLMLLTSAGTLVLYRWRDLATRTART